MTPEPEVPPKPLRRSASDRVIAGVCGGLAGHLKIPAVALRLIFLALAFVKGAGILAYVLAILLIPKERAALPPKRSGRGLRTLGGFLLILGLFLLLKNQFSPLLRFLPPEGIWWPLTLMLLGLFLLTRRPAPPAVEAAAPEPLAPAPLTPSGPPLRRSRDDRIILGICGGLGRHFGIDPTLMRLIWAAGTIVASGAGVVIYLVLYFLMPLEKPAGEVSGGTAAAA